MKYENPKIMITEFSKESVVTLSAARPLTAVESVTAKMNADSNNYKSIMVFQQK